MTSAVLADGVIVRCQRPCEAAKAAVLEAGGSVSAEFKYVDAIAAELPRAGVSRISAALPAGSVTKDLVVNLPTQAVDRRAMGAAEVEVEAAEVAALGESALQEIAGSNPAAYAVNNGFLNLGALHAAGKGGDVRVAVIDSGLRVGMLNTFGNIVGGEDFVGDGRGYIHTQNATHGTFVSGMIANAALLTLPNSHPWLGPIQNNCAACVIPGTTAASKRVYMIGSAPEADIYALRVFGVSGGAPQSRIMLAMERVIDLRRAYEAAGAESYTPGGAATALNIKVCNMSLGGSTFEAGRDLEDQLTNAFLENDIVLVTSAGNNGPSGSTGGSPGTGFGSLTVGAASLAMHERIRYDLLGIGTGAAFRPYGGTFVADFSSRGPTADGRNDPEVVANGAWCFGSNGYNATGGVTLSIGSGTSFSAPTVSGVAAVLREAYPGATARQIRNAIMLGANPNLIAAATVNDQGYGFVDAAASAALLAANAAPDTAGAQGGTNRNVQVNLVQGTGVDVQSGNVKRSATLKQGQRLEVYYDVKKNTDAVIITIPPVQVGSTQNVLFGDDVVLAVHSPKTSAIGSGGDYLVYTFTQGGTWVINKPDTGLLRVTVVGDWTNASPVGASLQISSTSASTPGNTSSRKIVEGDMFAIPFTVAAGAQGLSAKLEWAFDWGAYPTNDLDLILVGPSGVNYAGATIASPERVTIVNPAAGNWTAYVQGFSVPNGSEEYKLTLTVDGKHIQPNGN